MLVRIDASDLADVAAIWAKAGKDMPEAAQETLNRVGPPVATQVRRSLAKTVGLSYGAMKDATHTAGATPARLAFDISATGRPLPLSMFSPVQLKAGVRARPWGRVQLLRGAFLARSSFSAGMEVFKRIGGRRVWKTRVTAQGKLERYQEELPIRMEHGPAVPVEMVRGEPLAVFKSEAATRLPIEAEKQVAKILKGGRLSERRLHARK